MYLILILILHMEWLRNSQLNDKIWIDRTMYGYGLIGVTPWWLWSSRCRTHTAMSHLNCHIDLAKKSLMSLEICEGRDWVAEFICDTKTCLTPNG